VGRSSPFRATIIAPGSFISVISFGGIAQTAGTITADSVTLFASGAIAQTGGNITATNLYATTTADSGGTISLTSATNAIQNVTLSTFDSSFGSPVPADITFVDSIGFTIVPQSGPETGIVTAGTATLQGEAQ